MPVAVRVIPEWILDNKKDFIPPVCNKCMFSDQLKVFFVGGPNSRKDYHLEEGEEFFYQRDGDMVLKVIEKGIMKDIVIREGEIFLLPSRIEHSPQRFSNTVGFVVERTRDNTEFDCVRYFAGHSTVRLYERWLHLVDVVKDLPPLIKQFHESNEYKTDTPGENSFKITAPFEPRYIDLDKPINIKSFILSHSAQLMTGPIQIYGAPKYDTEVMLLGKGTYDMHSGKVELLLWIQPDSFCVLMTGGTTYPMQSETIACLKPGTDSVLEIIRGHVVSIRMVH
ncbi:unnamed protein product [Auanema sp. JU1783]|nr:unnamed protein product [Auanema sp. JU1783]